MYYYISLYLYMIYDVVIWYHHISVNMCIYIYIHTYLVCFLYLRLSIYTHRYMSYVGSNGVIPSWVSLQGLQNGVLHALAQICWSESLKSRRKKLWELLWSHFCLGEPNLTNKHLKSLMFVCCSIFHWEIPRSPRISVPPPAVFSRRAKRPWNPSSLRIITPGTSGSFGGVEAVDSDGVQLRRCGYKFDKRNSGMMEIEDIEKWWNDEFFFPGAWGSICVLWSFPNNKSPTESPSFGKDTKMLQPTNHVEHNSSLDNFTSWEAEGLHIQFAHLCLPRWLKF